ncbi:MAG TPA: PAS domain-containing sensor histidine kinase [Gemmatimonadaceae bacterium]|nr:PAS domain-containing sensor histidine kinase [Gemmatimonadaceae bacterium]
MTQQSQTTHTDVDVEQLLARLHEAEDTLRAIQHGEVDALVVQGPAGPRAYTLVTADQSYRMLVEQMSEGALTLNATGQILYANARFGTLLGMPSSSIPGRQLQAFVAPVHRASCNELFSTVGDTPAGGDFELVRADGELVPVHLSVAALAHESFRGLCAVVTDLREMRRRAAALEVERAARVQAEAANKAKSDFLAVMSHELRTPLNAVRGYADLMMAGTHGDLAPAYVEFTRRIQTSAVHLQALIEAVLGYAKLERGKIGYQLSDTRVCDLFEALETVMLPQATERGVHFSVDPCDDLCIVRADPDKAVQILINLATNAIKFTPRDGSVDVSLDGDDRRWNISVSDTGPGIPEDALERIFEPFFQVRSDRSPRPVGVGLGLAISRELARAMGGDVTVVSTEGAGSRFTLHLPTPSVALQH